MPFEKGHPGYPPKTGMPGRHAAAAQAARKLASEVRDRIPASAWVDYHVAIACGMCHVRWELGADGQPHAAWDDGKRGGMPPTASERTASVNWLADRGHGLPAQSIHLEADLRATVTHVELPAGALGLEAIMQIRQVVERARASKVIDASSSEVSRLSARSSDPKPEPDR